MNKLLGEFQVVLKGRRFPEETNGKSYHCVLTLHNTPLSISTTATRESESRILCADLEVKKNTMDVESVRGVLCIR